MDLEEKGELIPSEHEEIFICNFVQLQFPFKFKLSLFNWKKLMIGAWSAQIMVYISIMILMKPQWEGYTRVCILTACVSPMIGYAIVLLNMFYGGWGREESKFWCNLRIMYLSGYNTIRWCIGAVTDPCIAMAGTQIMGENIPTAMWSGLCLVYTYYILGNIEISKCQHIDWEKYENDFDVDLKHAHAIQKKNTTNVDTMPIAVCAILTIVPWLVTGWGVSLIILSYQVLLCINSFVYASSNQTFVVTDTQFDILQFIFRSVLLWMYVFMA